jgi:HEAT repeat protein
MLGAEAKPIRRTDPLRLFGPPSIKKLESKRDVAALVESLRGSDPSRSREATEALGRLGDQQAAPALIDALQNESLRDVASASLLALTPEAVDILVMALRQAHPDVRAASQDPSVRAVIAAILGKAGDQRAVEPLIYAIEDVDEVGIAAAEALGRLKDPRAVYSLSKVTARFGATAVEALGELGGEEATAAVVDWVIPEDGQIRSEPAEAAAAIRALGKLGPRDVVMPVIDRISGHFPGQGTPYGDMIHEAVSDAEASLGVSVV